MSLVILRQNPPTLNPPPDFVLSVPKPLLKVINLSHSMNYEVNKRTLTKTIKSNNVLNMTAYLESDGHQVVVLILARRHLDVGLGQL